MSERPTKRWKSTVEYDGSPYHGWQVQDNAISVQEVVEQAITKFSNQDIRIQAAGRTDTGVHANGQVFHFDLEDLKVEMNGSEISKAINAHMRKHPISIVKTEHVVDDFHARFQAKNKLYIYRILCRRSPSALDNNRLWHVKRKLDVGAMREGAKHLVGHHDFTTFRATTCQAKNALRTIQSFDVHVKDYDVHGGLEISLHIEAKSFLHHQIRNFAGTLVYVGLGKWSSDDVKTALEACDRKEGGPTAPSHGLSLVRVDY